MQRSPFLLMLVMAAVLAMACARQAVQAPPAPASGPVYAAESQAPSPPPRKLTVVAVGDIMLDRAVGERIRTRGAESILEQVAPALRNADLTFANLESPLASQGPHDPVNCVFRADPRAVEVLTHGGVDIVSVANNHTLDAGAAGLRETLDHLDAAGIKYCGAARERAHASWPRILEAGGLRVGFMAFTDLDFAHGSWSRVPSDLAAHQELLATARNKCDLLFVSYHWGQEYQENPSARQRQVARAAVDAGADVVLGHHPHVLQGIELYRGRPILYSMGNFVFDQRPGIRMESALFRLSFREGEGWQIVARPVAISRDRMGPQWPSSEQRDSILARLGSYCEQMGTPYEVREGLLWVSTAETVAGVLPQTTMGD